MLDVDLESRPRGIQLFRSSPVRVVDREIAHLTVQRVLVHVALHEVVGGPFDGLANLVQLTGHFVTFRPAYRPPG